MYLAFITVNLEMLNYIVICLECGTGIFQMIKVILLLHSHCHRENKHSAAISTSAVG